jgi:hypothetical protein
MQPKAVNNIRIDILSDRLNDTPALDKVMEEVLPVRLLRMLI